MNQGNSAGSGPFVITEWVKDDHITFVQNTNYWGAPKPRLKQVIFKHVATADLSSCSSRTARWTSSGTRPRSQVNANQFTKGIVYSSSPQAAHYFL